MYVTRSLGQSSSNPLVCTSIDCDTGEAAVQQMIATFNQLNAPSDFAPAVNALNTSFQQQQAEAGFAFSSNCCAILQIGQQATALTNQMLAAAGKAPIPGLPSGFFDTLTMVLEGVAIAAAVGLAAWGGIAIYRYAKDQPISIRKRTLAGRRR